MRHVILAPTGSRSRTRRPRTGFTLVELMVAMALSLFLMAILSEAFAVSMDTFRGMRALGDMQESLRNALRQMRDDLASSHFEGSRKMSDNGFWLEPRREGFIYMAGTAPIFEGTDPNGMASSRAVNHALHFAVRKQGYRPPNFFSVGPFSAPPFPNSTASPPTRTVPLNNPLETFYGDLVSVTNNVTGLASSQAYLRSQWAEVAYILRPIPSVPVGGPAPTAPELTSAGPITLYNLYRAEVLVLPYRDITPIGNLNNVSTNNNNNTQSGTTLLARISFNTSTSANFFSPNDLAMPSSLGSGRCFNPNVNTPNALQASLVCTNVVSFQVRLLVQQRTVGASPTDPNAVKDPVQPKVVLADLTSYLTNPGAQSIDTALTPSWANPVPPTLSVPDRIVGVQIRLRIYDPATGQCRQNTLVQGL